MWIVWEKPFEEKEDSGVVVRNKLFSADDFKNLEVALVHYWFVSWRGGEKVVESILKLFPRADVYTLFYEKRVCGKYLEKHDVYSSILDIPILRKHYQKIFPLYPFGIESLKLRKNYDLIISSESGPAKGIGISGGVPHLCYVHTPMRYCYGFRRPYLNSLPKPARPLVSLLFERLKNWDVSTVDNVTHYVANSQNVSKRISDFYKKPSSICYPPISLELFDQKPNLVSKREYYLSFGAITPYKNISLLVDAFNENNKRLLIIGEGSEKGKLMKKAGRNIEFLGNLHLEGISKHIQNSKALLFPGEEDFGMIPLEVMAHGIPVIAYAKGGALETVVENQSDPSKSTGIFYSSSDIKSLNKAIEKFESVENLFKPNWIQSHARKFGEDRFQSKISREIIALLNDFKPPCTIGNN